MLDYKVAKIILDKISDKSCTYLKDDYLYINVAAADTVFHVRFSEADYWPIDPTMRLEITDHCGLVLYAYENGMIQVLEERDNIKPLPR
jgi:hypothetical protein